MSDLISPQEEERRRIMRSLASPHEMQADVLNTTVDALRRNFATPIRGHRYQLEMVGDLRVADVPDPYDFERQRAATLKGGTIGAVVKGTFRVVNHQTGEVADQRDVALARIPTPLADRTFLVNGKKRVLMAQHRRRPGVFSRVDQRGSLVSEFNLDPSTSGRLSSFKIEFDRGSDDSPPRFRMLYGASKQINAWSVAKLLGATEGDLQKEVGPELAGALTSLAKDTYERDLRGLHEKISRDKALSKSIPLDQVETELREQFNLTSIDPDVSEAMLGLRADRVTKGTILKSFAKLRSIADGGEGDDRESLALKTIMTPADLIAESVGRASTISRFQQSVAGRLSSLNEKNAPNVDQLLGTSHRKNILDRVSRSMVQRSLDSTSPLDILANSTATTLIGEGAIKSDNAIPAEAKMLNSAGVGYLDPVHTPESARAGVVLHLPMMTRAVKDQRDSGKETAHSVSVLRSPFRLPNGEIADLSAAETRGKIIGMPDQYNLTGGKVVAKPNSEGLVKAVRDGEVVLVRPKDVSMWLQHTGQVFDVNSSLVPFQNSIQGGRIGYSAKQTVQSVSLVHREAPLVQVKAPGSDRSMEELLGEESGAVRSPVDGVVTDVIDKGAGTRKIILRTEDGKKVTRNLPKNIPMPGGTPLDAVPVVTVGQQVKRGDLLADSTFTKGGVLAMGVNLRTAYLPYHTSTFEDAITLSRSAADKLLSEHMYLEEDEGKGMVLSKSRYKSTLSPPLSKEDDRNLDDNGIVRVGTVLQPGQAIMIGSRQQLASNSDIARAATAIGMSGKRNKRGISMAEQFYEKRWTQPYPGEVVDSVPITKNGRVIGARVQIRTQEPMEVGDKIFGRHGNKGVVTAIIADEDMLINDAGERAEIVLNPAGVTSRINPSQNLETWMGKVAKKNGKPEIVDAWTDESNWDFVDRKLRDSGVADSEDYTDPVTGKRLKGIGTGMQYVLKARQQVEHKSAARGIGDFSATGQAVKGEDGAQALGELGVYALLGQNAREFLRDAQLNKSEDRPEVWDALARGIQLPPAETPAAFTRYQDYLKAAGVELSYDSTKGQFKVSPPVTDKRVREIARSGRVENVIKEPYKTVKIKPLGDREAEDGDLFAYDKPEKNGLFDEDVVGGADGSRWARFELSTPIPNPLYEGPIKDLLGLRNKDFEDIMAGVQGVRTDKGTLYGSPAIQHMLGKLDMDKLYDAAYSVAEEASRDKDRSRAYRTLRTIRMLKDSGTTPQEAFMRKQVLVLPANIRQLRRDAKSGDYVIGDLNYLYRDLALTDKELVELRARNMPPELIGRTEADLYNGMRALLQTEGSGSPSGADYQGILGILAGRRPDSKSGKEVSDVKKSFAKDQLLQRKQIMSARTVLTPDGDLGLDDVGIPRRVAVGIFEPLIEAEYKRLNPTYNVGVNVEQFKKFRAAMVSYRDQNKADPTVDRVLDRVVEDRWVAVKRDPALHKFSIQGFKPRLTHGKTVNLNPLVYQGFNADNDGDSVIGPVRIYLDGTRIGTQGMGENLLSFDQVADMPFDSSATPLSSHFIDIANFPHDPESLRVSDRGTKVYSVPPGVFVPAVDTDGKQTVQAVTEWSVHEDCAAWAVSTRDGRVVIASERHSLCVLNLDNFSLQKTDPKDSLGGWVPCLNGVADGDIFAPPPADFPIPVTRDGGWFIGALLGDGWIPADLRATRGVSQICLAYGDDDSATDVAQRWCDFGTGLWDRNPSISRSEVATDANRWGTCNRATFSVAEVAGALSDYIGRHAVNKRIAAWMLTAPLEFRRGVLEGLLDTDGGVSLSLPTESMSRGKVYAKAAQLVVQMTSVSRELAYGACILAASVGIQSTVGAPVSRPERADHYVVTFSAPDVMRASLSWLHLSYRKKRENIATAIEYAQGRDGIPTRKEFVPFPEEIRKAATQALTQAGATRKVNKNTEAFSTYVVTRRSDKGEIQRSTAMDIARWLDAFPVHESVQDAVTLWRHVVLDSGVRWDRIAVAEDLQTRITMYDLTVPGPYTFAMANGLYVWDTLAIFAPVSQQASDELREVMRPSANLFNLASHQVEHAISHESILGLSRMTRKVDGEPKGTFASAAEAFKAFVRDEIEYSDPIIIAGQPTTLGEARINAVLPTGLKLQDLRASGVLAPAFGDIGMTKGDVSRIVEQIAIKQPETFATAVNDLRKEGATAATLTGSSLRMRDMKPIIPELRKEIEGDILKEIAAIPKGLSRRDEQDALKAIYTTHLTRMNNAARKEFIRQIQGRDTNLNVELTMSNARIKPSQLQQVLVAPGALLDTNNNLGRAPVMRSYTEGMDLGSFLGTLPGARMGTVAKVIQVQEPGYLSKQLVNTAIDQAITIQDCRTHRGQTVDLSNNHHDLKGRILAADVKIGSNSYPAGTTLTSGIISEIVRATDGTPNVKVRSPLYCRAKDGVCQVCTGKLPNGEFLPIGHNFGLTSAQALGERSTQMMLSLFHEGGIFDPSKKSGATDIYRKSASLLRMPATMGGNPAVVSPYTAKVTDVAKNRVKGGFDLKLDNGKTVYIRDSSRAPDGKSSVRDWYAKHPDIVVGQALTDGLANPKEVLDKTGDIDQVRQYMTRELGGLFAPTGVLQRNVESMVRGLTQTVEVTKPGGSPYLPGERISLVEAEDAQEKYPKLKFKSVLKGVDTAPRELRNDNFLAKMNYNSIRRAITHGAAIGETSDIHGTNPIPGLFFGREFNRQGSFGAIRQDGKY